MKKNVFVVYNNQVVVNSHVSLVGTMVSNFEFCDSTHEEDFYICKLAIERPSKTIDYIPIKVSSRLVDISKDYVGKHIRVIGEYRSYNDNYKLKLFVHTKKFDLLDEDTMFEDENTILMQGYVCKKPIYRKTPLGREIVDVMIATNRAFKKSDYIPCIAWGSCARDLACMEVGTPISLVGRIQSREYSKKIDETTIEKRVAYEVSINNYV